jgi:hypothetical protein
MDINKIYTSNSVMDNIVHNLKILVFGTVLKNKDKAINNETVDSIREGDKFITWNEFKVNFNTWDVYPREVLLKILDDGPLIDECIADKNKIPPLKRNILVEEMRLYMIKNYQDLNPYYRMLHGIPPIGEDGILVGDYYSGDLVDNNLFFHQLNVAQYDTLEKIGVIKNLIALNPDEKYLNYLGSKSISYYTARKAKKLDILFVPTIEMENIRNLYLEKLKQQIHYTLKAVYSEALKLSSVYYDEFIEMFIKIQTMNEVILDLPEMFIRQDFFDRETMNEIFASNGLPSFNTIPSKYRRLMMQNLNRFIKYKSSNTNVIDVCNLFGFENIKVFQYYLIRNRKLDESGNFVLEYIQDPETGETKEDYDKNYSLEFLKVQVGKDINEYIFDKKSLESYESVTSSDYYWTGGEDPAVIKQKILEQEFNIDLSKYISINTLYDMNVLEFEFCYLFNTIVNSGHLVETLTCRVPEIGAGHEFRIIDLVSFLFYTIYAKYGIVDTIFTDTADILQIKGFNFEADLTELSQIIRDNGFTNADFMLDNFIIPKDRFLSFNEVMDVYLSNEKVYNHLVSVMENTSDHRTYQLYKQIHDALMYTKVNKEVFYIDELGRIANTYSEFIQYNDPLLYEVVNQVIDKDIEEVKSILNEASVNIIFAIEELLKEGHFKYVSHSIPVITIYPISRYIYEILSFFKSYMIDISNISNMYIFKDKTENQVKIYDKIAGIHGSLTFKDHDKTSMYEENPIVVSKLIFKDNVRPRDNFYIDEVRINV